MPHFSRYIYIYIAQVAKKNEPHASSSIPADAPTLSSETGASGAHGHIGLDATSPLAKSEPIRVHVGTRTLPQIAQDLSAGGGCIVDTLPDPTGSPRILTVHVPHVATHVIDVATIGDISSLRSALQGVRIAGFAPLLPAEVGLALDKIWDGQLAVEVLYQGQISKLPSLKEAGDRLGVNVPEVDAVSEYPNGDEISGAIRRAISVVHLLDRLDVKIRESNLEDTLDLDMRVRLPLNEMSAYGIRVDEKAWRNLYEAKLVEVRDLRESVLINLGIDEPHNSEAILHQLRKLGLGLNSASTSELQEHVNMDGISELIKWRKGQAFVNDTGKNVLDALEHSTDGRVHPAWNVLGTVTGRITSDGPNLLGVGKTYRKHFIAEPGNVLVAADVSAAQLRMLAEITGDEALIEVFRNGGDPHAATAALFSAMGAPIDREKAKPINFGVPFGMTADGLVDYARDNFGFYFTVADAEFYIDEYRAIHPGIAQWQDQTRTELPSVTRSIGGRIRSYAPGDCDFRSRLASPIQGTEADAMKRALLQFARELPALGGRLVLVLYDGVLIECPEQSAKAVSSIVARCLREGLEYYLHNVPVVVNVDVRRTWGG